MTLDVEAEVGRLIRQLEKLALGDASGMSVNLGAPPGLSPRQPPSPPADPDKLKLWPTLGILLAFFVLAILVTYYWAPLLIIGLALLVLGLIVKNPWAVIIAIFLSGH